MSAKTVQGSLSRSLIEDFGLQAKKPNEKMDSCTHQLGGTLSQRAENIYHQTKNVRNFVMNAKDNPVRMGCSVVALLNGLASMYNGDVVIGGISAALGAKELYNQCSDGNGTSLQRMLNDINADVDMIRSLEEGQQKSFDIIEENLGLIHGDVQTLYAKLDEVRGLNVEHLQALQGAKKEAYAIGLQAKDAYRKALELFKESQDHFNISMRIYEKCSNSFLKIEKLATSEDETTPLLEKMDALIKAAKQANRQCDNGKRELGGGEEKFKKAMVALSQAMVLKDQALEMIAKTAQSAEDALKAGIEKTKYTTACQTKIESTQKELLQVKERGEDILRLLDEMTEDVKRAKKEAGKKLNPSDLIVGISAGVILAPVGSVVGAIAGATGAAYAWHHGTTISHTAKKAYHFFLGKPDPIPTPMGDSEQVRINFQKKSSGYYGAWVKGRQSYTVGKLDINLGKGEFVSFGFDLNNQKYPISKEDIFSLYRILISRLGNGTMTADQCRTILDQLQKIAIHRGELNPATHGLIKEKQAAYCLVKSILQLCNHPI